MLAGEDSSEWWFLAVEHVRDRVVGAGLIEEAAFSAGLAQARTPGFVMLGPLSIQVPGAQGRPGRVEAAARRAPIRRGGCNSG